MNKEAAIERVERANEDGLAKMKALYEARKNGGDVEAAVEAVRDAVKEAVDAEHEVFNAVVEDLYGKS